MKLEPPADMREMANAQYQMFVAYVDAGFTPEQAGGRVAGRSVMVPDAKHGSSWTAAVGCYVLQGQPYPVRVGRGEQHEAEGADLDVWRGVWS